MSKNTINFYCMTPSLFYFAPNFQNFRFPLPSLIFIALHSHVSCLQDLKVSNIGRYLLINCYKPDSTTWCPSFRSIATFLGWIGFEKKYCDFAAHKHLQLGSKTKPHNVADFLKWWKNLNIHHFSTDLSVVNQENGQLKHGFLDKLNWNWKMSNSY